jgi:tRNA-modifying protein YgfZ
MYPAVNKGLSMVTMDKTVCLLSDRSVLSVSGKDRANFLQSLISNDIGLCAPKQSIYAALLTPQGKFLHDMFVYESGEAFLLDCEAERADDLLQRLTAYKLRAQVTLENVSDRYEVLAFPSGGSGLPDPRLPALGSRDIVVQGKRPGGFQKAGASAYDKHRLRLGIADGSRDMVAGKSTLSDGNFDLLNGVSWTKGCYVGQELTARMHHRALVKKRLFPVTILGTTPAAGSILRYNDAEIGEMRSSQGTIGLALLNIEQAKLTIQEGGAILGESAKLAPSIPEWLKI